MLIKNLAESLSEYMKKAIKPQEWEKMFADASSAGYQNYEISLDESDARLARLHWDDKTIRRGKKGCKETRNIRILSACFSGHRRFPLGKQFQRIRGAGNPDDEGGN